ncbi:hypothetical protein CDAR_199361 [Caerostris darwini]|uniref:Uncharacterized protein n=1 Tax=Caerostris darwini TaxID=1538125 RepID=A0AAV4U498_9ARAC|nr:hypothetical protein CDAR_199361 [Caerostris darwini]
MGCRNQPASEETNTLQDEGQAQIESSVPTLNDSVPEERCCIQSTIAANHLPNSNDLFHKYSTPFQAETCNSILFKAVLSIEEVAKDLPVHEKDSDLLELEMRARVIRSLLKAKSEDADPEEPRKNEQ